jgi:hypothetical protein
MVLLGRFDGYNPPYHVAKMKAKKLVHPSVDPLKMSNNSNSVVAGANARYY